MKSENLGMNECYRLLVASWFPKLEDSSLTGNSELVTSNLLFIPAALV